MIATNVILYFAKVSVHGGLEILKTRYFPKDNFRSTAIGDCLIYIIMPIAIHFISSIVQFGPLLA